MSTTETLKRVITNACFHCAVGTDAHLENPLETVCSQGTIHSSKERFFFGITFMEPFHSTKGSLILLK